MFFMIPLNGVVASKMKKYQISQMKDKDRRCKMMDEILNGIKGYSGLNLLKFKQGLQKGVCSVRNWAPNIC